MKLLRVAALVTLVLFGQATFGRPISTTKCESPGHPSCEYYAHPNDIQAPAPSGGEKHHSPARRDGQLLLKQTRKTGLKGANNVPESKGSSAQPKTVGDIKQWHRDYSRLNPVIWAEKPGHEKKRMRKYAAAQNGWTQVPARRERKERIRASMLPVSGQPTLSVGDPYPKPKGPLGAGGSGKHMGWGDSADGDLDDNIYGPSNGMKSPKVSGVSRKNSVDAISLPSSVMSGQDSGSSSRLFDLPPLSPISP